MKHFTIIAHRGSNQPEIEQYYTLQKFWPEDLCEDIFVCSSIKECQARAYKATFFSDFLVCFGTRQCLDAVLRGVCYGSKDLPVFYVPTVTETRIDDMKSYVSDLKQSEPEKWDFYRFNRDFFYRSAGSGLVNSVIGKKIGHDFVLPESVIMRLRVDGQVIVGKYPGILFCPFEKQLCTVYLFNSLNKAKMLRELLEMEKGKRILEELSFVEKHTGSSISFSVGSEMHSKPVLLDSFYPTQATDSPSQVGYARTLHVIKK